MRVYVAAPLAYAKSAHALGEALRPMHEPVSRWAGEVVAAGASSDPAFLVDRARCLRANKEDIARADVVVALAYLPQPRATYTEIGYALGRGLPVVWVQSGGAGRNIFDADDLVHIVEVSAETSERSLLGLVLTVLEDCRAEVARNASTEARGA